MKEIRQEEQKSKMWFRDQVHSLSFPYETVNGEMTSSFCIKNQQLNDIINRRHKFVVSIDVKERDGKKDRAYARNGYKVFHVIAFDDKSLRNCLLKVCKLLLTSSKDKSFIDEIRAFINKEISSSGSDRPLKNGLESASCASHTEGSGVAQVNSGHKIKTILRKAVTT